MRPARVRFVLAPFLPAHQPALGVSSLCASLEQAGHQASAIYLNLDYMSRIGQGLSNLVAKFSQVTLLGDVVFAKALWGEQALPFSDYWNSLIESLGRLQQRIVSNGEWAEIRRVLAEHRSPLESLYETNHEVVARWAERLMEDEPRVLGFSSTFQQHVASLALAREVRRRDPGRRIALVFGGANCEDDMGRALAAEFPFLDYVVSGEAEGVIGPLIDQIAGAPQLMPYPRFVAAPKVERMDTLPFPKLDDYFPAVAGAGLQFEANLVAESARGCWWGERAHCKFCGLNGNTMAFRSKNPARMIEELRFLRERFGLRRFLMTDNILDMGYLRTLLPAIAGEGFELFYEIKANLHREDVLALARAGVRWVQPGIESLDSGTLRLIAKGCTALQNIQLLKWCAESRVEPFWSILFGFPGESIESLRGSAELIPSLVHLPAPMQAAPFQVHRFSPYFFDAGRYGIGGLRPAWGYRFAYPGVSEEVRSRLAYCFEFEEESGDERSEAVQSLLSAVECWIRRKRANATLSLIPAAEGFLVYDTRREGAPLVEPVSALEKQLLDGLAQKRAIERVAPAGGAIEPLIEKFRAKRWIVEDAGEALSLVFDYGWAQS